MFRCESDVVWMPTKDGEGMELTLIRPFFYFTSLTTFGAEFFGFEVPELPQ